MGESSLYSRCVKCAVAFVEVSRLAYPRNAKMLAPLAGRKLACNLQCFGNSSRRRRITGHSFGQNASVEFMRRLQSEKVQDGGSEIDVATRQIVQHRAPKAGTGRDQNVVDVKFAQGGVAAF